jgi:hypothetical protein
MKIKFKSESFLIKHSIAEHKAAHKYLMKHDSTYAKRHKEIKQHHADVHTHTANALNALKHKKYGEYHQHTQNAGESAYKARKLNHEQRKARQKHMNSEMLGDG